MRLARDGSNLVLQDQKCSEYVAWQWLTDALLQHFLTSMLEQSLILCNSYNEHRKTQGVTTMAHMFQFKATILVAGVCSKRV